MHVLEDTANLVPLWVRLRASFARAVATTGGAARIAAHASLAAELRREIYSWIALFEQLVRRLLFAEAARLAYAPHSLIEAASRKSASASRAPPPNNAHRKAPSAPDTQNPETWSVRFALAPPRDPRAVPEARAPRIRALWGPSPAPTPSRGAPAPSGERNAPLHLARRFEALRRVLLDPAPHARRLAALMRRLVRRYPEAPLRFVLSGARSNHFDREDPRLGVDCSGASLDGLPAFNSS